MPFGFLGRAESTAMLDGVDAQPCFRAPEGTCGVSGFECQGDDVSGSLWAGLEHCPQEALCCCESAARLGEFGNAVP